MSMYLLSILSLILFDSEKAKKQVDFCFFNIDGGYLFLSIKSLVSKIRYNLAVFSLTI